MPRPPRSLDALLTQLQAGERELDDHLPTFGGPEPRDTAEIWSWDPTRLLVGTCRRDLCLVPRVCPEADQPGTDGAWLARSRRNLGLTQAELAEALGLAGNTVARIERDELPLTRVTRLAVERVGQVVGRVGATITAAQRGRG
jgi:hypothetical protein